MVPVAPLPIANREPESHYHNAQGRHQHDKNCTIERALSFLRCSPRSGIAHGATLGEGGTNSKCQNRCQQRPAQLREEAHRNVEFLYLPIQSSSYCKPTPFGGGITRPASGKKKKYMITKQAVTDSTSIHRINDFSNFKCMK